MRCDFICFMKQSLNSDGQQFHQYQQTVMVNQQNEQSTLTFTRRTQKPTKYDVGNQGPDLKLAQECGGGKSV